MRDGEGRERRLRVLLTLNKVPGLGPARIRALRDAFGGLPAALRASSKEWTGVPGIGRGIADALAEARDRFDPSAEIERAESMGIDLLMEEDGGYPSLLREIHAPPPVLYVLGGLPGDFREAVAVVGTRRCSHYGRMQAEKLSGMLAGAGLAVVSGLARGIDTYAHRAALEAGGRTVAVLGSGLNRPYPPENAPLLERIAERGAVLSEFPLDATPQRSHFPRRNRIISGMSLGVVVVEAAKGSGSLITARWAAEQGREVFAVPGKIDSLRSSGTHALIKDGAKLVENVEDVLEEIAPQLADAAGRRDSATADRRPSRDPTLQAVWDALEAEPVGIDEIVEKTGLPASSVAGALFMLEMKHEVRPFPGRRFARR